MLFSVRLVSRQPAEVAGDVWQGIVGDQLRAVKELHEQGKIRAIYRETGVGVLAIFDVEGAQEMDQTLAGLPMFRYFQEITVHPLWDMVPSLPSS